MFMSIIIDCMYITTWNNKAKYDMLVQIFLLLSGYLCMQDIEKIAKLLPNIISLYVFGLIYGCKY